MPDDRNTEWRSIRLPPRARWSPRKETKMPKPRSTVSYVAIGVLLTGTLLGACPCAAGLLDASWTPPTTNTDGSPLTDLAFYRLYYGPSTSPCPGSASLQVAAPKS